MKIKICDDGMLIIPETDFESDYLQSLGFGRLKSFVKHGLTPAEVVGIQIEPSEEELGNIGIGEDEPKKEGTK